MINVLDLRERFREHYASARALALISYTVTISRENGVGRENEDKMHVNISIAILYFLPRCIYCVVV